MSDGYTPVKGKCTWWREAPMQDDIFDVRLKEHEKRVYCSCFVEGRGWTYARADIPENCPENLHCRYYIKFL